jgi:hypothetical protein
MNEERLKILRMVEEKKLSADEASRLLDALGQGEGGSSSGSRRWLRIRVYEHGSEKPNVNVNVPLSIAKWALKFIPKSAKATIDEHEIDLDELISQIQSGAEGKLLEVNDEEAGDRVEVYVE